MAARMPSSAQMPGVQAEAAEEPRERACAAGCDAVIHHGGLRRVDSVEVVDGHWSAAVLGINASCTGYPASRSLSHAASASASARV